MMGANMLAEANPVTKAEARRIASEMVGIDDQSSDEVPVAPYYIFSRGVGQGFVIVSGDDSTAPIIGYTEQGDYDHEQLIEPLREMLDAWGERIAKVQQLRQYPKHRSIRARAVADFKSGWEDVPALVKTHWHQSSPYNDMAPLQENGNHCATGCVATAGSQIAYYFHKDNPTELQYATPTYSYGVPVTVSLPAGTPIRWDLMRLSGSGTAAQNEAVATLVYALGASAGLTYGASTSGHNYRSGHWNMADALRGQFHLDYAYKGKWDANQQQWEELIYSNLKTRRPMLYSGVHPESGGHSVVLDGYQASTGLYHFNFGWGGQGDGWYTVDDETGMNGFAESQDLVYNFTPQQQNLSGKIVGAQLFHRAPSNVEVTVSNDGTLDYKGVYLYISTTKKMPTQVSVADAETELVAGENTTLTLTVTPTNTQKTYIFLCGKNKQLLDSCSFEVTPTRADLHLGQMAVDVSDATVEVDGMSFGYLNNTKAQVTAVLTNGAEGTYCQPTFSCNLQQYDTSTREWTTAKTIQMKDQSFQTGETQKVLFTFDKLTPGALYRACLGSEAQATGRYPIAFDTPDSVVYFSPREADLAISTQGRFAVVTGHWNATLFTQAATDANVCSYDMTGLAELNTQPVAANPNALFYVSDDNDADTFGANVIVGDVCKQLTVRSDAEFKPLRAFTATQASFVLADAKAGQWLYTVLPFAADIPYGMQVKKPVEWGSTVIEYQAVRQVEVMTPVVYLTGHDELCSIESQEVSVTTDTIATAFDNRMISSTVGQTVDTPCMLMGESRSALYFIPVDAAVKIEPFQTYLAYEGKQMGITTEALLDSYYKLLSQTINEVYATLAESRHASADDVDALKLELKKAEDMLTYRSAADKDELYAERTALIQAQRAFERAETAGIKHLEVTTEGEALSAVTEYYNLSGQRLEKPERGIVIVKHGTKSRKMFIK